MAAVLTSFAELAKVLGGNKVKAKQVGTLATYEKIQEKHGEKAAIVWAFMQDQEACKRYGAKGEIMHDLDTIKVVTGYEDSTIIGIVVALVRNGFARMTPDGTKVRAA